MNDISLPVPILSNDNSHGNPNLIAAMVQCRPWLRRIYG
jgi:hypothetical protein